MSYQPALRVLGIVVAALAVIIPAVMLTLPPQVHP
jgi:hypothetical protein